MKGMVDYMKQIFTKKDLKTGDIIVRRNDSIEVVNVELGGTLVKDGGYNELSSLKDDLTESLCEDYDVMEVYRPKELYHFNFYGYEYGELMFDRYGELMFDRESDVLEPLKITMREIEEKFGCPVVIVREE